MKLIYVPELKVLLVDSVAMQICSGTTKLKSTSNWKASLQLILLPEKRTQEPSPGHHSHWRSEPVGVMASICWLTPPMATMATARPGQAQSRRPQCPQVPTEWLSHPTLSSAALPGALRGNWTRSGAAGPDLCGFGILFVV